jgi:S1-C subfamily serine protease
MTIVRRTLTFAALASALAALVGGMASGATRTSTTGVVVVDTNLSYQDAQAAGTGIVLTSSGEVLTNNHVIRGATTIHVVVPQTGRRYTARVVGYAISKDVAVLQLAHATGLRTAAIGRSSTVRRGDHVTAVGNAGGTGRLVSAQGTVTAVGRTITASDGESSERLTGLIETDARLQPGDSGGPLLDGAGRVVGIDTAASSAFSFRSTSSGGFAIPIDRAVTIAKQIVAGRGSSTVHVGETAFLGVGVQPAGGYRGSVRGTGGGALVMNIVSGSPAARAGLAPGDVITAIDGRKVATPSALVVQLQRKRPGDAVELAWVDRFGSRGSGSARLVAGPPQ